MVYNGFIMSTYQDEIQSERDRFAFLVQRDGIATALALMKRNRKIHRIACLKKNKNGVMIYSDPCKSRDYRLMYARAARGISILLRESHSPF